jgi:His-Xaa-Ser system protein HxsD
MGEISELILEFDARIYRLTAVKKAAYKFGNRCHIQIEAVGEHQTRVVLRAKGTMENFRFLAGEFQNEVLDQELRETVTDETKGIQNLLLAQAFSATSLLDPLGESADEGVDPLNILSSDQCKNKKQLDPSNSKAGKLSE